jgi:hypothetical protein
MIVQVERCVNEVLSSYVHGRERIGVLVGRMMSSVVYPMKTGGLRTMPTR